MKTVNKLSAYILRRTTTTLLFSCMTVVLSSAINLLGTRFQTSTFMQMRRTAIALLLLTAGMMVPQPCAAQSGSWTKTGRLVEGRYYHTATLLPDGKVLVAGGQTRRGVSASAEQYDPALATWTTTGSLATARYVHTATLLPNGKVLVAGGLDFGGGELGSAEL